MFKKSYFRILSNFLAFVILMLQINIQVAASEKTVSFLDIKGHYSEQVIENWAKIGFVAGFTDGTFRPKNSVTRAEYLALFNRSLKLQYDGNNSQTYLDVSNKNWYYNDVMLATKMGLIWGYENGEFGANDPITREDASVVVSRYLNLAETYDTSFSDKFSDKKSISNYAQNDVLAMAELGIISGFPDGTFKPKDNINRADAILILNNLYKKVATETGITGKIYVENKILEDANIEIFKKGEHKVIKTIKTDINGLFDAKLDVGEYDLVVSKGEYIGFKSEILIKQGFKSFLKITLEKGQNVEANLKNQFDEDVPNTNIYFKTNQYFRTNSDSSSKINTVLPKNMEFEYFYEKDNKLIKLGKLKTQNSENNINIGDIKLNLNILQNTTSQSSNSSSANSNNSDNVYYPTPTATPTAVPTAVPTSTPTQVTYSLVIQAGIGGTITSGASSNYVYETIINISAASITGYKFSNWITSFGGVFGDSNNATTTFAMPSNSTTVTAIFVPVSNETYTKGQWIKLISEKLNFTYTIDEDNLDYFYGDTQEDENGVAIEIARLHGILPPPDSQGYLDPNQDIPLFMPKDIATREFVAYTVIKAMGFVGNYVPSCSDVSSLKYPEQSAIAIRTGFIKLVDNNFMPNSPLTGTDKNIIFNEIDEINASTTVDLSNTRDTVEYSQDVIVEPLLNVLDYTVSYSGDIITVVLPKSSHTSAIKVGDKFVLPSNNVYMTGIALKAETIADLPENKLSIICSIPKIEDVIKNFEFVGAGTMDITKITPSDGVSVSYNPNGGISNDNNQIYRLDIGGSTSIPGTMTVSFADKDVGPAKVSAGLEIEVPNITVKAKGQVFGGFNIDELVVSQTAKIKVKGEIKRELSDSGFDISTGRPTFGNGKIELYTVPIVLGNTGLLINIVFFANVDVSGSVSITYELTETFGFQYTSATGFRWIKDFSSITPTIEAKGSARFGVGMALKLTLLTIWDLSGIDGHFGIGLTAKFTPHLDVNPNLYCGDATIYLYATLELDIDTLLGLAIDRLFGGMVWSWDIYDEDRSTLKLKWHFENMVKVPQCTYGEGTLKGKVVDASNQKGISGARISLYNNTNSLTRTVYSSSGIGAGAFSIPELNPGNYILKVSATGYKTYTISVPVNRNQETVTETQLMIKRENEADVGTVSGSISDAVTGSIITNVMYKIYNNWNTISGTPVQNGTVQNGTYLLELLPGNYTIQFIKNDYVNNYVNIAVQAQNNTTKHVVLSPSSSIDVGGNMRIVLTWGSTPRDLDSHLYGPTVDNLSLFHVYFSSRRYTSGSALVANLDRDVVTGYGPETTTINKLNNAGIYSYYVHNYTDRLSSNSQLLSTSGAQVKVYSGNVLVATYNVPTDKNGTLWHVFDYNASTGAITVVNSFSYINIPESSIPNTQALSTFGTHTMSVPVDNSELSIALNKLKDYISSLDINNDEVTMYSKTITEVEELLNNSQATQEELDHMVDVLIDMINTNSNNTFVGTHTMSIPADNSELSIALNKLKEYISSLDINNDEVIMYSKIITEVEELLNNSQATQEELDHMVDVLIDMISTNSNNTFVSAAA